MATALVYAIIWYMVAYWLNKFLSVFGVGLLILGTYVLYGYTPTQWHAVLLAIVVLGYGHYFVGFYYQLSAFKRSEKPIARYKAFVFLTLLSVLGSYVLLTYVGYVAALLIGALYFLMHGLLNEQTLILRQTNVQLPLLPLCALTTFFIGLLLYAVPDQTFFFDYGLQFAYVPEFIVAMYFSQNYFNVTYFQAIFYITMIVSVVLLVISFWRYSLPKTTAFIGGMIGILGTVVFWFGAPAYIYMHLLVVGYHFLTWLLFYCTEMYKRGGGAFRKFVGINLGVTILLVVVAILNTYELTSVFGSILFDYRTFVVLTYVHITTSFMNDGWWQALENRFFT